MKLITIILSTFVTLSAYSNGDPHDQRETPETTIERARGYAPENGKYTRPKDITGNSEAPARATDPGPKNGRYTSPKSILAPKLSFETRLEALIQECIADLPEPLEGVIGRHTARPSGDRIALPQTTGAIPPADMPDVQGQVQDSIKRGKREICLEKVRAYVGPSSTSSCITPTNE